MYNKTVIKALKVSQVKFQFNMQSTTFCLQPWNYSILSVLHREHSMFVFELCHKLVMVRLSEPYTHIKTNVTSYFSTLHKLALLNTKALCRIADKRVLHYALINAAKQR